jgi:transposase InsO family protein
VSEAHLRAILKSWVEQYNCGRPHSSLGPGVPGPPTTVVDTAAYCSPLID